MSILDVEVYEDDEDDVALAVLAIEAAEHGWSIEALVENTPDYLEDGVESATASARTYVADPDDLDALARELASHATMLRNAQAGGDA